jgi:ribosomal protein S18 acetylase RimI-like enzyme
MIHIKRVTDFSELEAIRALQEENLKKNLTSEQVETQGFVTAEYSIDFLRTLHAESPSVIAKDKDRVVGYALVVLPSVRHQHELLADLFNAIDRIEYNQRLLRDSKYVVVGQLCVAREYRGLGIVQKMYQYYKDSLAQDFDYCITDVAENNPRSLQAHKKSGFQIVATLQYGGLDWNIILWDWKEHNRMVVW